MNLVEKARIFATASHHAAGNVRKYTGEPYINHPAAVVGLVADMVEMLTDVSHANDGLRAHRKRIDREHTAKASPAAKTIKLADLIDNTRSIVERDPKFAEVYLKEKRLLLDVLTEGDATLHAIAIASCSSSS